MGRFIKGEVVVIPFPFSDLSQAKRRPALVVAALPGNDLILCQITSKNIADRFAVPLTETDFAAGALKVASNVRPNRIFTADHSIVLYSMGRLNHEKTESVIEKIVQILRA
ncbi:MAG: type II toxin-antitoxin system PemK/MazF family toxin [Calditrichaeota bacterium]|nr:MAG: type II toxin-antitoxin system PemK/MazF family toxin [Calditrichota bacterium]